MLFEAAELLHDDIGILAILYVLGCDCMDSLFLDLKLGVRLVKAQTDRLQSPQVKLLPCLVRFLGHGVRELLEHIIEICTVQLLVSAQHFVNYGESAFRCGLAGCLVDTLDTTKSGTYLGQP